MVTTVKTSYRTQWQTLRVAPEATMGEALRILDAGKLGIALVSDASHRLLGTITDGDIRRALLRQVNLETPVTQVMERNFTSAPPTTTPDEAVQVMRERFVRQLPILSTGGRIEGLYALQDLVGTPPLPNWAVIMAGGEGRRLRPLTRDTPKPMLEVDGRPILENIINRLVRHGFRRIFISVNYLADKIRDHFGDGSRFNCNIQYLEEIKPLGTGGSLALLPGAPTEPILVTNGDLWTDVDVGALLEYHSLHKFAATMCVHEFGFRIPFGVVDIEGQTVRTIEEKPVQRAMVNAGVYVLEPSVVGLAQPGQRSELPDMLMAARRRGQTIGAFPIREQWVDIGNPEDYQFVQAQQR